MEAQSSDKDHHGCGQGNGHGMISRGELAGKRMTFMGRDGS
jgi:hypothetical protein